MRKLSLILANALIGQSSPDTRQAMARFPIVENSMGIFNHNQELNMPLRCVENTTS